MSHDSNNKWWNGGLRRPITFQIMNLPEDKPLHRALGNWKISEPLPPRFSETVWRRIARAEAPAVGTLGDGWRAWLSRTFSQPVFAAAYVAVLLVAGVAAGYLHGQARQQRVHDELAARYVQSLDPYQHNSQ